MSAAAREHVTRERSASTGLGRFFWRYFKRYSAWTFAAVAATLVFALSTVSLVGVFQLILAEVIQTDQRILEAPAAESAAATEGEDSAAEPDAKDLLLRRIFGDDVDPAALIERAYAGLRAALGIDDANVVIALPLLFAAIFFLRSLSGFLNGYIFQIIGLGLTNDLRDDLYDDILHQSSRFFSEHSSGELVSRVSNDISVMQNAVSNRLLDLFQQSVTLVFLIVTLLLLHFQLAVICLVVVPAVFYPIVRFGRGMRRTSRRSQERLADLSSLTAEAVRGHRVVKAFGMEDFELERFRQASARHLKVKLRSQLLSNASGPVVETLAAFGATAFLIYVGFAVRDGDLRPSQIMTFLTTLVMLYDPIRKLNKVNLILQEALAAAQRVRDLMEIENDVVECQGAVEIVDSELPAGEPHLVFENVVFGYGENEVLRGIDVAIRRGEVVALVGRSGAGKSTFANLLPRFFDPDSGRVLLGGHDLRDLTLKSLRAQIGIVTQDTVLFNDTVRNNIAYGRADLPLERVRQAASAAYADDFVIAQKGGYDAMIGESGVRLSGGQRQRLAIARAILKDPPILILDEATSHLDTESEAWVQKALHNLMQGRTAVVIAHRLSTIKRADRILVMDAGRVIEEGTHEILVGRDGPYRRLYEMQFRDD